MRGPWRPTRRVYADAAAATPLSWRARWALARLQGRYGNAGALHSYGVVAKAELERARATVARAIGAHPDEIVFTASGTEANNLALQGVLRPLLMASQNAPLRRDMPRSSAEHFVSPHVITTAIEHPSVLEPLRALARPPRVGSSRVGAGEGAKVSEVGVDSEGVVDLAAFKAALRPETVLVSVQLVNSEVGTIEPVKEVAKLLRKEGRTIYFHTDASQAPLWLPLNVDKLGVDLMTLDAQKILGPKGVGCLYVRRGVEIEPVLWGGRQESGLRSGTENVAQAAAFAAALRAAQQKVAKRAARVAAARDTLWREIKRLVPDAILNGPQIEQGPTLLNLSKVGPCSSRVANNINVSIPGLEAQMAVVAMDALGVAVSTRSACSAGEEEPSHVIKALGTPDELSGTAVRITLLPNVSQKQVRKIAQALAAAAARYRKT